MGLRRTAAVLLSASLMCALVSTRAVGTEPASPDRSLPRDAHGAFEHYRRALQDTLQKGDEDLRRFFEARRMAEQQAQDARIKITWVRDIHDMTGDRVQEVLIERLRFTMDPVGFGFTGDYRGQVVDGSRGSKMWAHETEYHGGFPTIAMPIRLGGGVPGLLFPAIDNQSAESPTYRLTLEAVDHEGTIAWNRVFTSTYTTGTGEVAGTDVPLTLQRFDMAGNRATDFLVALADYVVAYVPDRAVVRARMYALDAADGSMTPIGEVGPEQYWFPSIQAGPDVDGDGGHEILIAGEENSPDSYVEMRSAQTGDVIWRRATPLGWYPWAYPVPDMTGDGVRDMIIGWDRPERSTRMFEVWDARKGRPLWTHKGSFPYVLGDADGDGRPDLGAYRFVRGREKTGVRFVAFSGDEVLYQKSYIRELPKCDGFCFSFGFYMNAGDLDADQLRDTYVVAAYPTDDKPEIDEFTVAGRDGRLLYRQRRLAPVLGSLDSHGDDLVGFRRLGSSRVEVTAYDGRTREELWQRVIVMDGARGLGPYGAYDSVAELDGTAGSELLLTVAGKGVKTLLAIDGNSGEMLWQRPMVGRARVSIP